MSLYIVSFAILFIAFLGLAAGVLLGREPIKGSCGGIGGQCGACAKPCAKKAAAMTITEEV